MSEVGLIWVLVEVLEELRFFAVPRLVQRAEALVSRRHIASYRGDLVKNDRAPHITILYVVQAFVSTAHELVNDLGVAHLVVLSPVVGQVQFRLLGSCVPTIAKVVDNERHVAAVLAEQAQRLEVCLDDRAGSSFERV